ncbi:MAG: BACON domain-containing protein, partial [Proteiniphilum sp.]|nr:BACON domain-containing protein [Proteiniphilum sp.]
MNTIWITFAMILAACGGNDPLPDPSKPDVEVKWEISPATTVFSDKGETKSIVVTANGDWTVTSGQNWCSLTPDKRGNGQTLLKVTATANPQTTTRTAELTFSAGKQNQKYT